MTLFSISFRAVIEELRADNAALLQKSHDQSVEISSLYARIAALVTENDKLTQELGHVKDKLLKAHLQCTVTRPLPTGRS